MKKQPNLVLISTHDTGRHLGCYGVETVHDPLLRELPRMPFYDQASKLYQDRFHTRLVQQFRHRT